MHYFLTLFICFTNMLNLFLSVEKKHVLTKTFRRSLERPLLSSPAAHFGNWHQRSLPFPSAGSAASQDHIFQTRFLRPEILKFSELRGMSGSTADKVREVGRGSGHIGSHRNC